ncbi:hypothetical protein GJ496_007174 [Pomphorhynchus laevis]|nr:hypothetical protein GJ496_007174 [Pomphorhynchus laevis]
MIPNLISARLDTYLDNRKMHDPNCILMSKPSQYRLTCFSLKSVVSFLESDACCSCLPMLVKINALILLNRAVRSHDIIKAFLQAAEKRNLTLHPARYVIFAKSINLPVYNISNGTIRLDPERLLPILSTSIPTDSKSITPIIRMLAYFSRWIYDLSSKVKILYKCKTFLLNENDLKHFKT